METDIESELNLFFDYFNIPKVKPTLDMKELLEEYWCHSYYENENGLSGFYELHYSADQWWGCDLYKIYSFKDNIHSYERIAHGEGDSPFYSLMAMTIDAHKKGLLPEEELDNIKAIFTGEINGYEYI